jgi:tripartite-type tricarboxylate transporter receptor subunit TctC
MWTGVPGDETAEFDGVAVPRGTPQEIIALLNREINLAIADRAIRKQFSEIGAIPITCNVSDCGGVFAAEIIRWRQIVALSHARKTD